MPFCQSAPLSLQTLLERGCPGAGLKFLCTICLLVAWGSGSRAVWQTLCWDGRGWQVVGLYLVGTARFSKAIFCPMLQPKEWDAFLFESRRKGWLSPEWPKRKWGLHPKMSIPLGRAELLIPQPNAFEFSEPLQSAVTANKGVGARVQELLRSPCVSGTAAVLRLCPSGVGCDKVTLLLDAELHRASNATKYEIQGCSLLLSAHWGGKKGPKGGSHVEQRQTKCWHEMLRWFFPSVEGSSSYTPR